MYVALEIQIIMSIDLCKNLCMYKVILFYLVILRVLFAFRSFLYFTQQIFVLTFSRRSQEELSIYLMKLSPIAYLFIIAVQWSKFSDAHVRGSVRPLVKDGGAINPHLSNIEVRKVFH